LNPAYHRWATPPEGPHNLLLPIDSAELFAQNLTQLTPDELLRVNHHIVQSGETLTELATRYNTNVMTIRMLNGLKDVRVEPGMDLRVPSGTTQLPVKVLRAAAIVDGPQPSARNRRGRPEVHVVRRGESIWSIARRNDMDPRTLMRLNGKKPGDKIMPGERLIVSASGRAEGGSAGNGASSSGSSSAGDTRVTHRVRSGETLSAIARRYGVTVAQIASWNGISANRVLRVGQRLTIRKRT
jgi:membrane-bound lytic murein transglycosylase D